jgi:hypothetical protein
MDNTSLNELITNTDQRQFWIKQKGHPDWPADYELQSTTDPFIPVDFSECPSSVKIGDILIIHRIKHAKIMFVAEVLSQPVKATREEIEIEEWRERWCWRLDTGNLTPDFGSQWREQSLKSFALMKEYNEANPRDIVNIGRLNFGAHVRVSLDFAKSIFQRIMHIDA